MHVMNGTQIMMLTMLKLNGLNACYNGMQTVMLNMPKPYAKNLSKYCLDDE